jgi:hypothetical protein
MHSSKDNTSVSEYFEVSFHIFGEIIDDHIYTQIIDSIKKIDGGIINITHPNRTNVIEVLARWNKSEIDRKMKAIQKIANVKDIKSLKKQRKVVVNIRESIKLSESVVSWKIKSETAEKVSNIINESIINKSVQCNIRVSFLIFGPGKDSEEYRTHRLPLKNMIEKDMHQIASFPEDLNATSDYLVFNEYSMMEKYDYAIILLMSIGSISEFSTFFIKRKVAPKIRLYVLKKYAESKSYLNNGPIRQFERVHKQVYKFNNHEDLMITVARMVMDLVAYKIITDA